MSTLIWLVLQQPKKMFNILISQYISGICGLPVKRIDSKRTCVHQVLIDIHFNMNASDIYQEYIHWLSFSSNLSVDHKQNLRHWVCLLLY